MAAGHKTRWGAFACLALLALAVASPLPAQEVRGIVRDRSTGFPLANVLVRIDSLGSVTLTEPEGSFFLRNVPKGDYTLSFEAMGYERVVVAVQVPIRDSLEIRMPPQPIELPGIEVRGQTVQTRMDLRLARLLGSSRVVDASRVRLYDTLHAKDPWKLLWRELRVGWDQDMDRIRGRFAMARSVKPEVYLDDQRTWLINLVLMPNTLLCRVEMYQPPPHMTKENVPFQLRAYTCLFMAEVAEGKRELIPRLNYGGLIAGPGGG